MILNKLLKPAKATLIIHSLLIFSFSLLSGSETYGGGLTGIIKNSPNSLPWIFMIITLKLTWKHQRLLGLITIIIGITSIFFFKTHQNPTTFTIISLPLITTGLILTLSKP